MLQSYQTVSTAVCDRPRVTGEDRTFPYQLGGATIYDINAAAVVILTQNIHILDFNRLDILRSPNIRLHVFHINRWHTSTASEPSNPHFLEHINRLQIASHPGGEGTCTSNYSADRRELFWCSGAETHGTNAKFDIRLTKF
jgi:hypothetical protein